MAASKHFFNNKDIGEKTKPKSTGPLNALLWGYESWNLSKHNMNKFTAFHHSTIRRILGIKWSQVREKHIKNTEVRGILCNISMPLSFKRDFL